MITSMDIKEIATFDNEHGHIGNLNKLNFFYGSNGSGKTTISRVLNQKEDYPESTITWENKESGNIIVYNLDFVKKNFSTSTIPGIYTMGEESIETEKQIEELREKYREKIAEKQKILNNIPEEKIQEHFCNKENACRRHYEEVCWKLKESVKGTELEAFIAGYKSSKFKLFSKLLDDSLSNHGDIWTKEQLISYMKQMKQAEVSKVSLIIPVQVNGLQVIEKSTIFNESVVGKSNSTIGTLIEKIGNGQWVLKGKEFIEKSKGKCPFCQQELPDGFSKALEDYFDHTYTEKVGLIAQYADMYAEKTKELLTQIDNLISLPEPQNKYINTEDIKKIQTEIASLFDDNQNKISEKVQTPGNVIALQSSKSLIQKINKLIEETNERIVKYNDSIDKPPKVDNIDSIFWRYAVSQFEKDINNYNKEIAKLNDNCKKLQNQVKKLNSELSEITLKGKELQKHRVSIRPTVDKINQVLKSFGFTNFSMQVTSEDDETHYQIVRADGTLAKETLSEGEANFITFLYFYFSLDGTMSTAGTLGEKVIVIDDPVSSLDSNVLYIVSTLVKGICKDKILQQDSGFTQLLLFTHNVYFYHELTANPIKNWRGKISYYIIRKINNISSIEHFGHSPIKTTYQMMWELVKKASDDISRVDRIALLNVMRRILEYYFKTLGNLVNNDVYDKINGEDRFICHSLLALENSQSHGFIDDTVNSTPDEDTLRRYLVVFRKIFEVHGSLSHYNMMMGIDSEAEYES